MVLCDHYPNANAPTDTRADANANSPTNTRANADDKADAATELKLQLISPKIEASRTKSGDIVLRLPLNYDVPNELLDPKPYFFRVIKNGTKIQTYTTQIEGHFLIITIPDRNSKSENSGFAEFELAVGISQNMETFPSKTTWHVNGMPDAGGGTPPKRKKPTFTIDIGISNTNRKN